MRSIVRRLRGFDAGDARQRSEKMWATLHERKPGWEHVYQSSWQWPHRTVVVDTVRELGPHDSILELGCNAGQNIIALHKGVGDAAPLAGPFPPITGIDINPVALQLGRDYYLQQGWSHVNVHQGIFPEALELIPDRSHDLVFAVAVLMHVAPGACEATVAHALRIARRHVLFVDLHTFQPFMKTPATGSPFKALGDRWERDWWSFFPETSAWRADIRELRPQLNLAYQGDINAVIVGRRKE